MTNEDPDYISFTKPRKQRRWLGAIKYMVLIVILLVTGGTVLYVNELTRLHSVITLFDPPNIVRNFIEMDDIFDTKPVRHGEAVWEFERAEVGTLPETFTFEGEEMDTQAFLDYTQTTGLIILHNDKIVFEEYSLGNTESTPHISWSVAKSFTSALFGIAMDEGYIDDLMDPVTKYVPALANSGYNEVPIKHVLQMSSGIRFDEEYGDFDSDINRMGRALALDLPLDDFVLSLENELEPGTYHRYVSMDTQVLGMVLREAVQQDFTAYFEEKIWKPVGMESDAYWLIDSNEMELAFAGLNCVLRDYARLGELYLHKGRRGDTQIVPEAWVTASVTPDAPHLQPGENPASDGTMGYGYQWWIPAEPDGDYLAIGVYNQFVYVNPKHNVVIAKNSANAHYVEDDYISEPQSVALFRAIVDHLVNPPAPEDVDAEEAVDSE